MNTPKFQVLIYCYRLEIGPNIYIRKEHENVLEGPSDMIKLGPRLSCRCKLLTNYRQYCIISNPVVMKKNGQPQLTEFGQIKNRFGEQEVRTAESHPDPFPLYPGEELTEKINNYIIITQNQALRLVAIHNFYDESSKV